MSMSLARYSFLLLIGYFVGVRLLATSESAAALVAAVRVGDQPQVLRLLDLGTNSNASTPDGTTALHWAVYRDSLELAAELIQAGARVDSANRYGVTPLMLACTNGNAHLVALLLKAGADANHASPGGETPLMMAARTGRPEPLRCLLANGARTEAREDWHRQTALMWAAAEGHLSVVQALLDAGAEVGTRTEGGFTAYLFAARQGHIDVVRQLLAAGVPVDQCLNSEDGKKNRTGPSALGLAVINAHFELAAVLLDAGADPNFTWDGRNILHEITRVRRPGQGTNDPAPAGSGDLGSLDLVRKIVTHGAHLDARMTRSRAGVRTVLDLEGATPFLLAARTADVELMKLLAELGADPLLPNQDNTTPLLVAAGVGVQSPGEDPGSPEEVFEAVKIALDLGNDVNAVDNHGETAMHGAAYKYAAAVVPLLVERGAKIEIWNQKNRLGWTPLRIATGVHRSMNLRSSPETATELRRVMIAAGVSTKVEPEMNISGGTK